MASLAEIETLTRRFADAHQRSAAIVTEMNDAIEQIQREARIQFKRAYQAEAAHIAMLHAAIQESPELFEKPRTVIFHGVKVGLQKGKGKIEIAKGDYERVCALIKKHFPDRADVLIITKEEPSKKNIADLSVSELKKIGLTVEETGDQVVISPTDSAVDKMFKALLKEVTGELDKAA